MGECYWHGCEVYPGHPCPRCEAEGRTREWAAISDKAAHKRAKKDQKEWTKLISNLTEKED